MSDNIKAITEALRDLLPNRRVLRRADRWEWSYRPGIAVGLLDNGSIELDHGERALTADELDVVHAASQIVRRMSEASDDA